MSSSDLEERLATTPTPKLIGLFRGVIFDYEIYDRFVLQRDMARVERFYRARGYYDAHARAGRVKRISDNHIQVEIVVEEGLPITVRKVTFIGIDGLPPRTVRAVNRKSRKILPVDAPFDEDQYVQSETDVKRALTDRGYAYAEVERDASIDLVARKADIVYKITPGKSVHFGPTTFEGVGELPEDRVRRTFDIASGEPYSTSDLDAAQQALLDLQVFSAVEITPDLSHPDADEVPLHVKVEVSKLRSIKLGAGVEFDKIRSDFHALLGWESHNFYGSLRSFSVQFRPGVVFYPLRFDNIVKPIQLLPMEKLRLELRQPGFLEARTNGIVRPEFNVVPFLTPMDKNLLASASVLGYAESKLTTGLDRTFWKIYGALLYNIEVAYPFTYRGDLDPALRTLVISNPELVTNLDLRDDRVHPHKGFFLGNNLQIAGGIFGGHASDIKIQPDVRGYIPLGRKVTLALRLSTGFLFPLNYGDVVKNKLGEPLIDQEAANTQGNPGLENKTERTRDFQIMYFRGLFSGGPNSNRGYPLRGIGPHAFVPFLNPDLASLQLSADCVPTDGATGKPRRDASGNLIPPDERCGIAVGGFTLWETSIELRIDLAGPLSTAVFCDASDVSPQTVQFRLNRPHLSCGLGARYDTPAGPIRLDIGYRIPGMQVLPSLTPAEKFEEGDPGDILGIPIAISFGIGESF